MKQYVITEEQAQVILRVLGDIPAKYSIEAIAVIQGLAPLNTLTDTVAPAAPKKITEKTIDVTPATAATKKKSKV